MSIRTEHLTAKYHPGTPMETLAVDDVNIEIHEGEFTGLIGHTGSGKSTLIQHLNGLLKPYSGRVLFNDQDIHSDGYSLRSLRGHVGLVFQYPEHQLFEENVLTDVCFGPKNLGLSEDEAKERAASALEYVGIGSDFFEKSPFDLSGGQKRRVAIAGVLAMEPEYLILDEPTAGLDPEGRDEILNGLDSIRSEKGTTIILVTHSMDDVARHCGRVIAMDHGRVRFDGPVKEVFSHRAELEAMGLSVPQAASVGEALRAAGFSIPSDAITVDAVRLAILKQLGTGEGARE